MMEAALKLTPGMEWPPKDYQPAIDSVAHDRAWLTGTNLNAYVSEPAVKPVQHRTQYNGGLVGGVSRAVLGRPTPHHGSATINRHLPVAAELAEVVGDMLFGNTPRITPAEEDEGNTALVENLANFTESSLFSADLVEAGQSCSALGWVFGRIRWDTNVEPHPWIEWVAADRGFAEFAGNRLQAVTFVETHTAGKDFYRLTETHRVGEIEYTLWKGTRSNLGMVVPVTDHPATAYLAGLDGLDNGNTLYTGAQVMTAWMVPNRAKNPAWDTLAHLNMYGKSDIQFGGGIWADIDKGYTDLWHEVDSARARLLVSEEFLRTLRPGQGAVFDWWQDVYPLGVAASPDAEGRIERVQFDMRIREYIDTIEFATMRAVGYFGLSPMTVGIDQKISGDMTATEVARRERRTVNSWRARSRYWRAGLQNLLTAWGHIDAMINNYSPPVAPVNVAMVEPVQDTDSDRARTATEWMTAEAASTRTRVAHLHPEWDQQRIDQEVAEIFKERAGAEPVDPFTVGMDEQP